MSTGKSKFYFLTVLALVAGGTVYFYRTAGTQEPPQVEAMPGAKAIEAPVTEQIMSAQESHIPASPANGADVTAQGTEMVCAPAEAFELFYANFKNDEELRLERTRFPLIKRVYSGSGEAQTEEVFEIRKEQILARDEMVYLDTASAAGYSEGIYANDPAQIDIRMGPEDSDPLTVHRFEQESGCWFLYEFISYEYSGSNTILAL